MESEVNFLTDLYNHDEKELMKSNTEMGNLLKSFSKLKEEKVY